MQARELERAERDLEHSMLRAKTIAERAQISKTFIDEELWSQTGEQSLLEKKRHVREL